MAVFKLKPNGDLLRFIVNSMRSSNGERSIPDCIRPFWMPFGHNLHSRYYYLTDAVEFRFTASIMRLMPSGISGLKAGKRGES